MFHPAYDVPRNAPLPTSVDKHHLLPSVPEISMIFSNAPSKPHAPRFCAQNHFDMHKQVRFQSPPQEFTVLPDKTKILPPNSLATQKFTDVYMANVPNRHLDLSMIDNFRGKQPVAASFAQEKRDSLSNVSGNSKERFTCRNNTIGEQNQTLGVTDIRSYKCSHEVGQNTERALEKKGSDEPTVKDLLKIIQQQNEQLLILQKQVSQLIDFQATQQLENQRPHQVTDNYCQRQTNVFAAEKPQGVNKGPLSKFAIDVTTSFEVSVRRQQNKFNQQEAKIQEITDAMLPVQASKSMGESLVLSGPVREDCPSPVNSVHVDMNDYSSDSDDDSTTSSSNIDWTLYNNIMDQVNNILRKAQKSSDDDGKYKDDTMKKVMEATVKHLKSVGISLTSANNADNFQRPPEPPKNYSPTEISFAVKQLLMKYLPPDHLAKAVTTKGSGSSSTSVSSEEMVDLVRKRPEFSFATLQYMKKYNLIRTDEKKQRKPTETQSKPRNNLCPKILDITALRQQPKLL